MAQITNDLRAILSSPIIYSFFQNLMGARKGRIIFVENYVKHKPGMKILDIGCGPADILAHLNDVDYWGFDMSEVYIKRARKQYASKGKFFCKNFNEIIISEESTFDAVLAIGLLHHLNDDDAFKMIKLAFRALKPNGRLLTMDPCYIQNQNMLARLLIRSDRGQNVRNQLAYEAIVKLVFKEYRLEIRNKRWIPYTHCIMECKKT